jgi:hypothetical protein
MLPGTEIEHGLNLDKGQWNVGWKHYWYVQYLNQIKQSNSLFGSLVSRAPNLSLQLQPVMFSQQYIVMLFIVI